MADIHLSGVRKSFGALDVIPSLDLEIPDGGFTVLLGPSGCGKSTILRMIAGLEGVSDGEIRINDRVVNTVSPADRGCAMVFQNYALYPHKTVRANLGFPLRMSNVPRAEIERRVEEIAGLLELTTLLDRYPRQLSGGQRQRVAMGRAMIRKPKVFLYDEPLSNLDLELRVRLRLEIAEMQKMLKSTAVYVTHDQTEAMTLADKVVVLRAGRIEQAGPPQELYHSPANTFVAGFIGTPKMNFLDVDETMRGGDVAAVRVGSAVLALPGPVATDVAKIGIRPEHCAFAGSGGTASAPAGFDAAIPLDEAQILMQEHLGDRSFGYLSSARGDFTYLVREGDAATGSAPDTAPALAFPCARLLCFDADGNRIG